jgi:hypothetical protein
MENKCDGNILWDVSLIRVKYQCRIKHAWSKGNLVIARLRDIYLILAQISHFPLFILSLGFGKKFFSSFSPLSRPPLFSLPSKNLIPSLYILEQGFFKIIVKNGSLVWIVTTTLSFVQENLKRLGYWL